MRQYHNLVKKVLENGHFEQNRTDLSTISHEGFMCKYNLKDGYPLVTTKKMDNFRWDSMIYEFIWYLSGENHIRNLTDKTSIWDNWADQNNNLETAYGRFWRRYPIPDKKQQLEGEAWVDRDNEYVNEDGTFDQIQNSIDLLKNNPNTRRNVVLAWHPSNASASRLPPCHFSFILNVRKEEELNVHLIQRSADIALGVPFNIASYSLLANVMANEANLEVGKFIHTIDDAHIYCGLDERSDWYSNNFEKVSNMVKNCDNRSDYLKVKEFIQNNAPEQEEKGNDHIMGLLEQISRKPKDKPRIEVDDVPIDELEYNNIRLKDYNSHSGINFNIAE
jgi:thymidylate synthase